MDRFDPNQWTAEFVSQNQAFCMEVLRDTNNTVVELVRRGQYAPAVSGLDRILNGLITMQNHAGGDYRSHICFFSWMEAEIIAFGVNAPEDKRRETALNLYEDARDYARSENTKNTIAAVIWDLKSGMSLDALQKRHDPDFPHSVVDVLADMNNKLTAANRSSRPAAAPAGSAPARSSASSSGSGGGFRGILIGLLIIICFTCLVLFLWGHLIGAKDASSPEPVATTGNTQPHSNVTEDTKPNASENLQQTPEETTQQISGETIPDEVLIVKTPSGGGLNLRMSPTTDSEILTLMPDDSVVTVNNIEGNWANVTYGNHTGWCSMDYLMTEEDAVLYDSGNTAKTAVVTTSGDELRLRSEPSLSSNVIDGMPNGSVVTVLSREDGWAYVEFKGVKGWCSSDYLTFQ